MTIPTAPVAQIDLDKLPLYFDREYYRVEDVHAALARAGQQAGEAAGDVSLPEMDGLADIEYAQQTPDDWDADYRATWQKLQVAERNKMQWRAYALDLRAQLASAQKDAEKRGAK